MCTPCRNLRKYKASGVPLLIYPIYASSNLNARKSEQHMYFISFVPTDNIFLVFLMWSTFLSSFKPTLHS